MVSETLLSKLQKIRESATNNTELNEAENAQVIYQRMLIEYNIADADVATYKTEDVETYARQFYTKHMSGPNVHRWKVQLAWAVATPNLCTVISEEDGAILAWLGKPSNIEAAQFLYETIMADIERIAAEKWDVIDMLRKAGYIKADSELRKVHGKSWKNSFYAGAVESISWRLGENLRQMASDKRVTALVTTNSAELNKFKNKMYPKLRHAKKSNPNMYSHSGFKSGQITGKEVEFRRGIGAGGAHAPNLLDSGKS